MLIRFYEFQEFHFVATDTEGPRIIKLRVEYEKKSKKKLVKIQKHNRGIVTNSISRVVFAKRSLNSNSPTE